MKVCDKIWELSLKEKKMEERENEVKECTIVGNEERNSYLLLLTDGEDLRIGFFLPKINT